jgi:NAD(P)-dependent dehydrogenase (short-subunit alcohol dehydrogenase family)
VAEVERSLGPVEILVNNAGVGSSSNPKPVVNFDDAFWDLSLALNLTAPYLLCKAVLPNMLKWGRIITPPRCSRWQPARPPCGTNGVVG